MLTFEDVIFGEFLERNAKFDAQSSQFWRMSRAKRRVHTPKREKCRTVEKRDPPQGGGCCSVLLPRAQSHRIEFIYELIQQNKFCFPHS